MQFKLSVLLVTFVSVAAASCSREPRAADGGAATNVSTPAWTVHVESVSAPAGPGTMLPRLTSSDRGVIVSWVERSGAMAQLKFAERTSSGWSQPTTVASGDKWFLSYADPPTVLRRPDGSLLANWLLSTNPVYEGSDLELSYSRDNGKTWAQPVVPHHDGTQQQHAFPSFFELPANGLGVVWLDGRDVQPSEANPEGGPMALRYATYDAQWKRTAEGVGLVKGQWRYRDVDIVAAEGRAPGPDLKPSGAPIATHEYSPKAGAADFDDTGWEAVAPTALDTRRCTIRATWAGSTPGWVGAKR